MPRGRGQRGSGRKWADLHAGGATQIGLNDAYLPIVDALASLDMTEQQFCKAAGVHVATIGKLRRRALISNDALEKILAYLEERLELGLCPGCGKPNERNPLTGQPDCFLHGPFPYSDGEG